MTRLWACMFWIARKVVQVGGYGSQAENGVLLVLIERKIKVCVNLGKHALKASLKFLPSLLSLDYRFH